MVVYRRGKPPTPRRTRRIPERRPFFRNLGQGGRMADTPRGRREMDPDNMRIAQIASTPVAGVPWVLRDAINKYTTHESRIITRGAGYRDGRRWGPPDALFADVRAARSILDWADVVMVHQGRASPFARMLGGKRVLCYYHSEPHRMDTALQHEGAPAYVIAQAQSHLYDPPLPVLPQILDIHSDLLSPASDRNGKLHLAYAPSNRNSHESEKRRRNVYSSKGWPEVQPALEELRRSLEVHVYEGVPYQRCLGERRRCHFLLDEVVTGNYHRCTLEACSQGQIAINACSSKVLEMVHNIAGKAPPWLRTTPERLAEDVLAVAGDHDRLRAMMTDSRKWMEDCWDPKRLLETWYVPAFRDAPVH